MRVSENVEEKGAFVASRCREQKRRVFRNQSLISDNYAVESGTQKSLGEQLRDLPVLVGAIGQVAAHNEGHLALVKLHLCELVGV